MGKWSPRQSNGRSGRTGFNETALDVFEQPERGLLGEALERPVGLVAALVVVGGIGAFVANQFFFHMDRIDDFSLLALFVSGGVLLSMLLRSNDPGAGARKRARGDRTQEPEQDLILEQQLFEAPRPTAEGATVLGLAEAPAASAPMPPRAAAPASARSKKKTRSMMKSRSNKKAPPKLEVAPEPVDVGPSLDVAMGGEMDMDDDEVGTFQMALVHYVKSGDVHGQGEVLRRLGHLAKTRGHLKESRDFYMNARGCFRKIEDNYAEAAVLLDLGQVLESMDQHDAASTAYRDANRALLDVAMNAGDNYNEIQAHAAD